MFDTKIKMRKGFFMNYHLGRWEGLAYTWQVLFKTVLLQCVHITGNYVPSHFIQTYIDCDHYLFVIPDYRRDDKKGGDLKKLGYHFFTIYDYYYYYFYSGKYQAHILKKKHHKNITLNKINSYKNSAWLPWITHN